MKTIKGSEETENLAAEISNLHTLVHDKSRKLTALATNTFIQQSGIKVDDKISVNGKHGIVVNIVGYYNSITNDVRAKIGVNMYKKDGTVGKRICVARWYDDVEKI